MERQPRSTIRSDCGRANSSVQLRALQITRSARAPASTEGVANPAAADADHARRARSCKQFNERHGRRMTHARPRRGRGA